MSKFPAFNAEMSITALTAIYNTYAEKPIKKFENKKQAIERLTAMAAQHAPKTRKPRSAVSISAAVKELYDAGMPRETIVESIMNQYPMAVFGDNAKLASKHVSWYISKIKAAA